MKLKKCFFMSVKLTFSKYVGQWKSRWARIMQLFILKFSSLCNVLKKSKKTPEYLIFDLRCLCVRAEAEDKRSWVVISLQWFHFSHYAYIMEFHPHSNHGERKKLNMQNILRLLELYGKDVLSQTVIIVRSRNVTLMLFTFFFLKFKKLNDLLRSVHKINFYALNTLPRYFTAIPYRNTVSSTINSSFSH